MVHNSGTNSLMTKMDIQHAFRLLPVRPSLWPLLGFHWDNPFYVDTRLPFGLRSSPGIFGRFADAVHWIIQEPYNIKNITHYADDFFLVSPPCRNIANQDTEVVENAFHHLGIPLASNKKEGPNTSITYLGINVNSKNMTINIPEQKYQETLILLKTWTNTKKCTKRELLSLIGKLSFLCKIVRPGRIFLCRLIDLSCTVKHNHHRIYINKDRLPFNGG